MIILPLLSVSSESGSDLIPSLLLFIMIVPSLIVIKLSQARAFFTAVISKVPPLIIKLVRAAPFIPFFTFPIIINFPLPLIVKDDDFLNLIPAPSKSSNPSFSSTSLSVIFDSPSKIKFTIAFFFMTNGPVLELSIEIEFKVIFVVNPLAIDIWHSEHEPENLYSPSAIIDILLLEIS